jgi:hypothetical protein
MSAGRKLHSNPEKFIQVVENALCFLFYNDRIMEWDRLYDFYEKRYLNPDSPEKHWLKFGHTMRVQNVAN